MKRLALLLFFFTVLSGLQSVSIAADIKISKDTETDSISEDFEDMWSDDEDTWSEDGKNPINIGGFIELGRGHFNHSSINKDRTSLNEARGRLELDRYIDKHFFSFKSDYIIDRDLDNNYFDIREAYFFSTYSKYDYRIGRQALTWGTGDLVFLNDLFPKDWQSFFAGREMSYLKAPVDALRVSRYSEKINVDIAFLAPFQSDRYLTGERFSFFNPASNALFSAPPRLTADTPSESISNTEVALRLFKTINNAEVAAYSYRGFYNQPLGFDPVSGSNYFPKLNAYGMSVLKPALGGITNSEIAFHHSVDDSDGDNPFIKNSEVRFLLAYERELISKLTTSLQYYLEWIQDYDQLIENSFNRRAEKSERRHTITLRLRYMALQDKLRLSWFSYYSPNEHDSWILPSVEYQMNDQLSFTTGANIFKGRKNYTFLGQFEENDNFYARIKFSF